MGYIRTSGASTGNTNTTFILLQASAGNLADEFQHFELTFFDPANASTDTTWLGQTAGRNLTPDEDNYIYGGHYTTSEAHVALKLYFSSGTVTGELYLFKRGNA